MIDDNQIISNELNNDYLVGSQQMITPFLQIPNYGTTSILRLAACDTTITIRILKI